MRVMEGWDSIERRGVLEVLEELLRDITVEVMVVMEVKALGQTRMVAVQGGMVVMVLMEVLALAIVGRMVEGRVFMVVLVLVGGPGITLPPPSRPGLQRLEGVARHTVRLLADAMVEMTGLEELVL